MTILRKNLTKGIPADILLDVKTLFTGGLYGRYTICLDGKPDPTDRKVQLTLKKGDTLLSVAKRIVKNVED